MLKLLIGQRRIAAKIREIAKEIDSVYSDGSLVLLMVLKGAVCFVADLIRSLNVSCDIDVVQCSSYGKRGMQGGMVEVFGLERVDLQGRDVLIVDDIFDSGRTLGSLVEEVKKKGPRSVRSLVLLEKKVTHVVGLVPDYVLFRVDDLFVVGYGLDYKERYRGLRGIYVFSGEEK